MRAKMRNNHQKLSAKGLHKRYGKRWVVRDVDLNVNKGEIVGLLGPNGAGKTTTFYMITGMIKPTKGQIYLDDNEEGGTHFPQMGATSPCKKGSMLMFPSLWTHLHAGLKPIQKPKYILGSYLHFTTNARTRPLWKSDWSK